MHSVAVKDHFMIAHSFRGEVFGLAQARHGAAIVLSAEFLAQHIHQGLAEALGSALGGLLRIVLEGSHVAGGSYEAPVACAGTQQQAAVE
ncbi:MAG: hypothetical protein CSA65_00030 [Proteobacteria bacterium]|nr:MAG: hypothetical protein CSA65_00030 [Pseudomonadota bacterium]